MVPQDELNKLAATVQSLKNRDLMAICAANYVVKSGNKSELQQRIIRLIDAAVHDPNPAKYQFVRQTIVHAAGNATPRTSHSGIRYSGSSPGGLSDPSSPGFGSPYAKHTTGGLSRTVPANGYSTPNRNGFAYQGLQFKASPFYDVVAPIGDVKDCPQMMHHRNTIILSLSASMQPELARVVDEAPHYRVMVFCAGGWDGPQDIAFPHQCEIKLNANDIKANLRGLKNKPGSTRPADITEHLRVQPPTFPNTLDFTYALTNKSYYLALVLCRVHTPVALAQQVATRGKITKASVVREVTQQAQDPDVVATSSVLSLKCPLTYMRLTLPVRATTCKHIQCFEALSYLQLQEQGPQWLCPICSNPAPFDALAVDEYVKDILEHVPASVEQVTIDPDGTWHEGRRDDGVSSSHTTRQVSHIKSEARSTPDFSKAIALDDDLVILTTPTPASGASGASGYDTNDVSTPFHITSRDTTATPSRAPATVPPGSGAKRQREVIDLTLDSDDEDAAPPKRINTGV